MRRLSFVILLLCALLATTGIAAAERPATAGKPEDAGKRRNFVVHMTGAQERPNQVQTEARGIGVFHLSHDGNTLRWMIVLHDIKDVTAAHIHGEATAEQAVGVLLPLFETTYAGEHDTLLLRGTISRESDADFARAIEAMRKGEAYVNVHTNLNKSGEIRGQFGVKGGGFGRGENHGGGAETEDEAKPQKQRGQGGQGQGQGRGRGQGGQDDDD